MIKIKILERYIRPKNDDNKQEYNSQFISKIQPQGGINFKEAFIRKGDGFETTIHIYEYPKLVNRFWLEPIMNFEGATTTLDTITEERKSVIKDINKSLSEQENRYENERHRVSQMEARHSYEELSELVEDISLHGEVMKRVHLRSFLSAKTIAELEDKVKTILEYLEEYKFRGSIFLNEQEYEWKSKSAPYETQNKYANKRKGKPIPANVLAGGFPFHFSQLSDPYGFFYGTTQTFGNVLFDLFHKDKKRKSYNAILVGKMGAGKSTVLKKLCVDRSIRNDKIRGFDITGEYRDVVKELNGRMIALDGSDGIINPLQVFKTSEYESVTFAQHLSKMTIYYRNIAPEANGDEIKEFENLLRRLYVIRGLWLEGNMENRISSLPKEEYPIFSDFLDLVRQELYEDFESKKMWDNLSVPRKERLERIELTITNLIESYGGLCNGITSIENFDDEQIVFFSIRNLLQLKPEIRQAQLFSVINLIWDSMLKHGYPQFEAFNKGELSFEDAIRFLFIMDEAHHVVNARKGNLELLNYLCIFAREARKYFGGMIFGSHMIRDFVPEGSGSEEVEAIKTLFELAQYKLIMQQDSNNLEQLQTIFNGQLSNSELNEIPFLETGDMILVIQGVQNIRFSVECSSEELELFGGGA